jgi:hypothetical protein
MEKNYKKTSLTEIILLIIVLVSVALILVDIAVNVHNEIDLQSQSNAGNLVLPAAAEFADPIPDWMCHLLLTG